MSFAGFMLSMHRGARESADEIIVTFLNPSLYTDFWQALTSAKVCALNWFNLFLFVESTG